MSVFVIPTRLALTPAFRFDDQSHVVHLYWQLLGGSFRLIELVNTAAIFSGSLTWLNQVTAVFMGAIFFGIVDFRSFVGWRTQPNAVPLAGKSSFGQGRIRNGQYGEGCRVPLESIRSQEGI